MKEKIDILVKLQNIETQAERIHRALHDIPKRIESLDSRLIEFEQSIKQETSALDELKKKYRAQESDVRMNASSIEKNKEKLSSVKNNKEYQAMLKAIEDIQAKNSLIEEEMLKSLEQIEQAEKAVNLKKNEFSEWKKTVSAEKETLMQEEAEGRKKLEVLEQEGRSISQLADPALLKRFNNIKRQVGSMAIAAVSDAICGGCKVKIPPQMYNELHKANSLKSCPRCQRLIYLEKANNNRSE